MLSSEQLITLIGDTGRVCRAEGIARSGREAFASLKSIKAQAADSCEATKSIVIGSRAPLNLLP